MAAEAIPLINSLLELMGLTAAGSTKGKKYDIPEKTGKKAKDTATVAAGLAGKNPAKVAQGVVSMMQDDPYEGLSEEEKKKLANEANDTVEGFGGNDNNNKKPNDKIGKAAGAAATTEEAAKRLEELKLPENYNELDDFGKSVARKEVADKGKERAGRYITVPDEMIQKNRPSQGTLPHEIKPTDKLLSDKPERKLLSQHKANVQTDTLLPHKELTPEEHSAREINYRAEHPYYTDRYSTEELDKLKQRSIPESKSTNAPKFTDFVKSAGKKVPALILGGILASIRDDMPLYGAEAMEMYDEDYLKELSKYANSDDPRDRAIFNQMVDDYLEDTGMTMDELIAKNSGKSEEPDTDWANIKPEAERLINSDDPEDRKKGHELIEKYYLGDKEEPKKEVKKSKGYGLTGMDLY